MTGTIPDIQTSDLEQLDTFYKEIAKEDIKDLYAILICNFLSMIYGIDFIDQHNRVSQQKNVDHLIEDLNNNYNLKNTDLLLIFSFIYIVTGDQEYMLTSANQLRELDLIWLENRWYRDIKDPSIKALFERKINQCDGMHEQLDFFVKCIHEYELCNDIKTKLGGMIKN